jgi:TolB-like protein/tetratricopeptide (TPR) repeat protein
LGKNRDQGWLGRLRERGVLRVAASYAVIAWLLLQIASVVLDPLGVPKWVMTALIIAAAVGFPVAIALAWFLEIGPHGIERDTAAEGVPRPSARGLRHYADAIVIGVLLVAVVVLLVRQSDLGKPKPPENPAIAVLPFENLSGDPEQEYFSDGLAEETLDRLGRVPGLKVIARSSSFGFKGKDVDAKTIAERLGVTTLLEGSVRRDGRRLKLTARLIDGATGQQIWSGSFDREMQDIFAVQAELAGAIVDAIVPAAKGSPAEAAVAPTTDLDAYDLYLAARTQLAIRTSESIAKSVDLTEQALRLDPEFARGQAQLAHSLTFQAMFAEGSAPQEVAALLRRAETAVHKALALDPDLSEAHGAYANLLRTMKRSGTEEQYKRALELNPNNASAWHDYAVYLSNDVGRREEADRATARALELDPRQPVTWANYLNMLARNNDPRLRAEFDRAVRTVGDMPGALSRFPYALWAPDRDGHRQELESALRQFRDLGESPVLLLLPGAVIPGFPTVLMQAGLAAHARNAQDDAPDWVYRYRAWEAVDLDRAAQSLSANPGSRPGVNLAVARATFAAQVAGLEGDWAQLEQRLADLRAETGEGDARTQSILAFWFAVQGRHGDAAESLARADPVPDGRAAPSLGSDRNFGLMDTVIVRVLRETGRRADADRQAASALARLQPADPEDLDPCGAHAWQPGLVAYASLAANEGLKDEAVQALRLAMKCGDLPFGFWPQLPWFQSLAGYAPYDELVRERERRAAQIRNELLALETSGVVPGPAAK